jgi:hypothetical protein
VQQIRDAAPNDGRDETPNERSDRNWDELMQEFRVVQTGTQILAGFLVTLPFQARFTKLDAFEVTTYLVLVFLAAAVTLLALAPVALHRLLFRRGAKVVLVTAASRIRHVRVRFRDRAHRRNRRGRRHPRGRRRHLGGRAAHPATRERRVCLTWALGGLADWLTPVANAVSF